MKSTNILNQLSVRYHELAGLEKEIGNAVELLLDSFRTGGKVLVCGNGGSASDANHIVGELMKSFERNRPLQKDIRKKLLEISVERGSHLAEQLQQGLPAVSLCTNNSLITAIANDIHGDAIFAQQVMGLGNKGDILIGLSTSGNAKNVIDAFIVAKAKGLKTIGLTGETGGNLKMLSDVVINVPGKNTAFIQELHLPVFHAICSAVETEMFE